MSTPGQMQRRALAVKALEVVRRNPAAERAFARGVSALAAGEGRVLIYGPIGEGMMDDGVTAARVAAELATITEPRVDVFINSPGGDVFEGLAIHAQLKRFASSGREVVVHVDGLAASAASFVAMAGTRVLTAENAMWMVHRASAAVFAAGNAGDMHQHADDARELAALLEKIDLEIAELYAARSSIDTDTWLELMSAETWFTADEAFQHGLTDEVENFAPPAARRASSTPAQGATGPRRAHTTQQNPQGIFMNTAPVVPSRVPPVVSPSHADFSARASEITDIAVPLDASPEDGRRYWAVVRDALERGAPLPRFEDTTPRRKIPGGSVNQSKANEYDGAFKSQAV